MKTSELLLHPVRMRVVQALLGDRALTTAQLQEELDDVPTATLYRHVATLLRHGVLEVTEERRVRGATERTYRVHAEKVSVGPEEARTMSAEEHGEAFLAFITARLADFDRYLAAGDPDPGRDRVGFRVAALNLTDEETDELVAKLRAAVAPYLDKAPAEGRRRRLLSTILMPGEPGPD